jgi:hypothetical protein
VDTRDLQLDALAPVNWTHPLNRGLLWHGSGWPNPGWSRGLTLRNAAGLSSGKNPNHGTLTSGPTWGPGCPDGTRALTFDGTTQYVNAPVLFQGQASVTMGCWFRIAAVGADRTLLSGGTAGVTNSQMRLMVRSTGAVRLNLVSSAGGQQTSDIGTVTANKWHYAACGWEYTGTGFNVSVQLDGSVTSSTFTSAGFNTFDYFAVGVMRWNVPIQFFNGSIAGAFVYDRYPTPAQMRARYVESKAGYPRLLNWHRPWSFGTEVVGGGGGAVDVTPATAALTTAAFAPTVTATAHQTATPGTLALTTAAFAPTVSATDHKTATPTTAALTTAAFAPTVSATAHQTATPAAANLVLTGFAPTVTGGAGLTLTPGTLSLSLTGFAPTVTAPQTVTPSPASLALAGFAPVVNTPRLVTPSPLALSLSAFAPTVTAAAGATVTPGTLALVLTGYAPTVSGDVRPERGGRVNLTGRRLDTVSLTGRRRDVVSLTGHS